MILLIVKLYHIFMYLNLVIFMLTFFSPKCLRFCHSKNSLTLMIIMKKMYILNKPLSNNSGMIQY